MRTVLTSRTRLGNLNESRWGWGWACGRSVATASEGEERPHRASTVNRRRTGLPLLAFLAGEAMLTVSAAAWGAVGPGPGGAMGSVSLFLLCSFCSLFERQAPEPSLRLCGLDGPSLSATTLWYGPCLCLNFAHWVTGMGPTSALGPTQGHPSGLRAPPPPRGTSQDPFDTPTPCEGCYALRPSASTGAITGAHNGNKGARAPCSPGEGGILWGQMRQQLGLGI